MKIKMRTIKAIKILMDNKEKHKEEFLKQLEGWKEAMHDYSQEMSKWANNGGDLKERPKEPTKPTNYSKDYDRLLELLNFHDDAFIELNESEFDNIVKDEFGWKGHFLTNSVAYVK